MSDGFQNILVEWEDGKLAIPVPEGCKIEYLVPSYPPPLTEVNFQNVIQRDLGKLSERIISAEKIVLLVEDTSRITRLEPFLQLVVRQIQGLRNRKDGFVVVVACGAHHHLLKSQMEHKYGSLTFPYLIHDGINPLELVHIGSSRSSVPLWFNREVVTADLRLSISTVNIHPMAGYSGGGKIILPGVAGLETIKGYHNLASGVPGSLQNPMRNLIDEVLSYLPVTFSWQILSRPDGSIVGVFGGDIQTAHHLAILELNLFVTLISKHPADLILAGCRPYIQNVLGTFKPLSQLPSLLKDRGTLIVFNEAWQGRGEHHWRNQPEIVKAQKERVRQWLGEFRVGLFSPRTNPTDFEELFPDNFQLLTKSTELVDFIPTQTGRITVIPYAPVTQVSLPQQLV